MFVVWSLILVAPLPIVPKSILFPPRTALNPSRFTNDSHIYNFLVSWLNLYTFSTSSTKSLVSWLNFIIQHCLDHLEFSSQDSLRFHWQSHCQKPRQSSISAWVNVIYGCGASRRFQRYPGSEVMRVGCSPWVNPLRESIVCVYMYNNCTLFYIYIYVHYNIYILLFYNYTVYSVYIYIWDYIRKMEFIVWGFWVPTQISIHWFINIFPVKEPCLGYTLW